MATGSMMLAWPIPRWLPKNAEVDAVEDSRGQKVGYSYDGHGMERDGKGWKGMGFLTPREQFGITETLKTPGGSLCAAVQASLLCYGCHHPDGEPRGQRVGELLGGAVSQGGLDGMDGD